MFGGFDRRELRLVMGLFLAAIAGAAAWHWVAPRPAPSVAIQPVVAAGAPPVSLPDSTPQEELTLAGTAGALSGRLDLNTANAEELELLPLIGPAKAKAIVENRETEGPFRSIDEIVRVPGFGEKTRDRLAPFIVVSLAEPQELPTPSDSPAKVDAPIAAAVGPVRVNHANEKELERLSGIGPVMARKIVEDRAARGPFRSAEELMRVKGIGPKTLEKNRHLIAID